MDAEHDASILLSKDPTEAASGLGFGDLYEIVLGGENNSESSIRR